MPTKTITTRKVGRPTKYTKALADKMCLRIENGESVRDVCEDEKMPSLSMFFRWVRDHEYFREQYTRAKDIQADVEFANIDKIAEKAVDMIVGDDKSDGARVQAIKLQVDTKKWILARKAPQKYSDKIRNEHTGKDGGPIETKVIGRNGIEFITSEEKKVKPKKPK